MIRANELDTVHILRTLRNTSRVYHNTVAAEVLALERLAGGATFDDVRALVAGARGRRVYETGDLDAGIWSASVALGLVDDCPTCAALLARVLPRVAHDVWDGPHGCAFVGALVCGGAIWIEQGRRRGEMALYVLPRAVRACVPEALLRSGRRVQLLERFASTSIIQIGF